MVAALLITLFVLLLLGVPIYMCLIAASIVALAGFTGTSLTVIAQTTFAGLDKMGLMAMPLFMFAAQIMLEGGIARRLLDWMKALIGRLPGGTAFTTHFTCMVFGALCGSSPATVASIGGIMYPELCRDKYDKSFSLGLISSSSAVAILIPPSVTMVIYGVATGASVGSLFMAGIGAGLVWTLVSAVYVAIWVKKNKMAGGERVSGAEFWKCTKRSIASLGVPLLILGGIYSGKFTATEASGVATVYAIFVAMVINREMDFKKLLRTAVKSAFGCAQVMILTSAAFAFGYLLTIAQVPQNLANTVVALGADRITFLLFVNILFLIAGMFMDGSGAVTILAPIVYPIGLLMGVDPVHLGVIVTANLAVGMITPPVGLNLFVAQNISGVPITKMMKGCTPFLICDLIALFMITYIEPISMFIPRLVF